MIRARTITDSAGNNPFVIPQSLMLSGFPLNANLIMWKQIRIHGEQVQGVLHGPRDFSFSGVLSEMSCPPRTTELVDIPTQRGLDAIDNACGLGNIRVYLYNDRYLISRYTGMLIKNDYPGVRDKIVGLDVRFTALDPRFYDNDGNTYVTA